jgi:hypothetical protein
LCSVSVLAQRLSGTKARLSANYVKFSASFESVLCIKLLLLKNHLVAALNFVGANFRGKLTAAVEEFIDLNVLKINTFSMKVGIKLGAWLSLCILNKYSNLQYLSFLSVLSLTQAISNMVRLSMEERCMHSIRKRKHYSVSCYNILTLPNCIK